MGQRTNVFDAWTAGCLPLRLWLYWCPLCIVSWFLRSVWTHRWRCNNVEDGICVSYNSRASLPETLHSTRERIAISSVRASAETFCCILGTDVALASLEIANGSARSVKSYELWHPWMYTLARRGLLNMKAIYADHLWIKIKDPNIVYANNICGTVQMKDQKCKYWFGILEVSYLHEIDIVKCPDSSFPDESV